MTIIHIYKNVSLIDPVYIKQSPKP